MLLTLLERNEGSTDTYGDPTITWTSYIIRATTLHPLGKEERSYSDIGTFRASRRQVTFEFDATYIEKVVVGNRLIYNGEQYEILLRDNWEDSGGNIIRVYALIEKAINQVSYT